MDKHKSGYHQDALNHTIPQIAKDIQELFDGYDEQDEKREGMKAMRKELQKIYAGEMNLSSTEV